MRSAMIGLALAVMSGTGALAQETPEAAYAQLHAATLAGNIDEAMGLLTAATRTDLAAKPPAERAGLFRSMAQAMPKTYTVNEKPVDGLTARLSATGIMDQQGNRFEVYLAATLRKEGEAWKVASFGWSNQKPAAPAPKPVEPAAAAPAAAEPVQQSTIVRRMPGSDPNAPATPAPAIAAKPTAVPAMTKARGPSRVQLDARACLKLSTDSAIRACAEKYR